MTPKEIKRARQLQLAVDRIRLSGGVLGASAAADLLGVPSANLRKHYLAPVWDIGCGGVYLKADVDEVIRRRKGDAA